MAEFFYAISHSTGELVTRDSRLLYATREEWEPFLVRDGKVPLSMPIRQLVPAVRILFGSLPLDNRHAGPDAVGAMIKAVAAIDGAAARIVLGDLLDDDVKEV